MAAVERLPLAGVVARRRGGDIAVSAPAVAADGCRRPPAMIPPAAPRPRSMRRRSAGSDGVIGHDGARPHSMPRPALILPTLSARPCMACAKASRSAPRHLVERHEAVRLAAACQCQPPPPRTAHPARRPARAWPWTVVGGAGRPPCGCRRTRPGTLRDRYGRKGRCHAESWPAPCRPTLVPRHRPAVRAEAAGCDTALQLRPRPPSAHPRPAPARPCSLGTNRPYSSRWKPLNAGSCSCCSK